MGYFATFGGEGTELQELVMVPFRSRRLRLERASRRDVAWLSRTLQRECEPLGAGIEPRADGALALRWRRRA